MILRIGTFNILNTSVRYSERKNYITQAIQDMNCDILGLQEVNLTGNMDALNFSHYRFEFIPLPNPMFKDDPNFRIDGNALLIKNDIEIIEKHSLVYSNNLRVAQILKVKKNNSEFVIANTHLDYLSEETRETQVNELLNFLTNFEDFPIVLTGDFNFTPTSRLYEIMTCRFKSSHFACHNFEPELTFKTGLKGEYLDQNTDRCIDYVWLRGKSEPISCYVFTLNLGTPPTGT